MDSNKAILDHLDNYKLSKESFLKIIKELTYYHYEKCYSYKSILKKLYKFESNNFQIKDLYDVPFIPINLFKNKTLKSIKDEDIYKVLESSGTTGQKTSKIYLDKFNARIQSIALSKIFTDFTALKRPNMLIIDNPNLLKNPKKFSARLAGIVGFRALCRKSFFALNSDMSINYEEIENCLSTSKDKILVYGFTYIIWLHFLSDYFPKKLRELFFKKAILLHGGGWKKLEKLKITQQNFKDKIYERTGIKKILNYYGMVEQTGSIFMECENGYLHSNPLCDVVPRSLKDINKVSKDNVGIAQVISSLPSSYPGHSLLSEDLIEVNNEIKCKCGRIGTSFKVLGRIKTAENRGCSDTYES
tara:strand:- start:13494 stop:14570 length:1077 start_codon:yes stop_codon:yes gene_type:complete